MELNAFTSDAFIKWIEAKLAECAVTKLVPDAKFLEQAYRRAAEAQYINLHTRAIAEAARVHADGIAVPSDLRNDVQRRLHAAPEIPWDQAVGEIATEGMGDEI